MKQDKIKDIIMSNAKIAKCIAILLGIGIIVSTYYVFLKILNKKVDIPDSSAEIVLKSSESAEIKDTRISEGKIYLLISSSREERLVVIDEKARKEILNIVLKKEKDNE